MHENIDIGYIICFLLLILHHCVFLSLSFCQWHSLLSLNGLTRCRLCTFLPFININKHTQCKHDKLMRNIHHHTLKTYININNFLSTQSVSMSICPSSSSISVLDVLDQGLFLFLLSFLWNPSESGSKQSWPVYVHWRSHMAAWRLTHNYHVHDFIVFVQQRGFGGGSSVSRCLSGELLLFLQDRCFHGRANRFVFATEMWHCT